VVPVIRHDVRSVTSEGGGNVDEQVTGQFRCQESRADTSETPATPHFQPDASADQTGSFVVQADRDGELTLEHWVPEGGPWCHCDIRIENGTTLTQLGQLADDHMAEAHRTVITLSSDDYAADVQPANLTSGDLELVAAVTRGLSNREVAVMLDDA